MRKEFQFEYSLFGAQARSFPTVFPTSCFGWLDLLGLGISDITRDWQERMERPMPRPHSALPFFLHGN